MFQMKSTQEQISYHGETGNEITKATIIKNQDNLQCSFPTLTNLPGFYYSRHNCETHLKHKCFKQFQF